MGLVRAGAIVATLLAIACGSHDELPADRRDARPAAPAATEKRGGRPRVVVLGDSLTAGLGLAREDAFPSVLQNRLDREGLDYEVVNAGVSGDTSAGGLSRLEWALDG